MEIPGAEELDDLEDFAGPEVHCSEICNNVHIITTTCSTHMHSCLLGPPEDVPRPSESLGEGELADPLEEFAGPEVNFSESRLMYMR